MTFPGTRPIHGDTVHISVGTTLLVFTGSTTCQGEESSKAAAASSS
ncbi:hypothetical protein [Streptomyces sp. BBFR102]